MERLRERGPSFFRDLAAALSFDPDRLRIALSALVAAGWPRPTASPACACWWRRIRASRGRSIAAQPRRPLEPAS
jgi:hypothetical protein